MAQENIDFGTFPDDPNADAIRTAFEKVQNNFTQLFTSAPSDDGVLSINITNQPGITRNSPTGHVLLSANIAQVQIQTSSLALGINAPNNNSFETLTNSAQILHIDLPNMGVDNVLYVSKSGNNDNNGQDLLNSKLTIASAVTAANALQAANPTGVTAIFVKAGDYTEINPITLSAGVSIVGDNLRAVTVRPTTKTSDIFWVNNRCYITGVTFRGHLDPAAAVAFPNNGSLPFIVTSPYVQNCSSITEGNPTPAVAGTFIVGELYTIVTIGTTDFTLIGAASNTIGISFTATGTGTGTGTAKLGTGKAGAGMRVDGNLAGGLKSMVLDAYTQFNSGVSDSGGIGIHITNQGYSQLVSIFSICCSAGVKCESGGTCSITNSNNSFGVYGLWADGVGPALFTGTLGSFTRSTLTVSGLTVRPAVNDAVTLTGGLLVTAGSFVASKSYTINEIGTTDFTLIGAASNTVGVVFTASGVGAGTGTALALATAGSFIVGELYTIVSLGDTNWNTVAGTTGVTYIVGDTLSAATIGSGTGIASSTQYILVRDATPLASGTSVITFAETLSFTPNLGTVSFRQISLISASGQTFEYVGTGTNLLTSTPRLGGVPIQVNEIKQTNGGRVNFTSTDQFGDFRIGSGLLINEEAGVIEGTTFDKSLFAVLTPYILALEG